MSISLSFSRKRRWRGKALIRSEVKNAKQEACVGANKGGSEFGACACEDG